MRKLLQFNGLFIHLEQLKISILTPGESMQGLRKIMALSIWLAVLLLSGSQARALSIAVPGLEEEVQALDAPSQADVFANSPATARLSLSMPASEDPNSAGEEAEKEKEEEEKRLETAFSCLLPLLICLSGGATVSYTPAVSKPTHLAYRRLFIWYAFSKAP